jgi:hypothetical protein
MRSEGLGEGDLLAPIRYIPVDVARLAGLMCVVAPELKTDPTSGEIKLDRDGKRQWVIGVAVREPGSRRPTVIEVTTLTEPERIGEGSPVRLMGLTASQWEMEGRSGISWKADEVLLGAAPAAPVAAAAPAGSVAGKVPVSKGGEAGA